MGSVIPAAAEKMMPRTPVIDFTASIDTSNLKGKSVLVTGGASGIGFDSVKAFAAAGALVTVADLQQEAGSAITKDLSSQGHKVQFVQTDVTNYESQTVAFKSAVEFGGGKLDIVVASAGIAAQENLFDMAAKTEPTLESAPPEPGFSTVEVNLKGVYYTCYLAIYYFRIPAPTNTDATPFKKSIVMIASSAGYIGYPSSTTYSMSKFGVRGILAGLRGKAMAQEPPVRVNLVAPWFVKTAMTDDPNSPDMNITKLARIYGLAPIENVTDAILRMSVNEDITGRAALIMPDGNVDLEDDIYGAYGGAVMQKQMGKELEKVIKAMAEMQAAAQKTE